MSDSKAKVNTPGERAFMEAVRRGDGDAVRAALAGEPTLVHAFDNDCFGATAMNHAGNRRDRAMVDLLLEHGGDINARSDWWAGSFGVLPNDDREMSAFLIERAAEIDARDFDHESTAAQWQASRRPAVARYLVEQGAQADVFMTIAIGDAELVRSLVSADPGVLRARVTRAFFPTSDGTEAEHIYIYTLGHNSTPLHVAANLGRAEIAAVLLDAGADVNATGAYDDCTPLHLAAWSGHVDVAGVLLERGADIDRKSGKTHKNEPVGWAGVAGNVAMVEFLLQRGATVQQYHIEDAQAAARDGASHTSAPREAFARIAEMLQKEPR